MQIEAGTVIALFALLVSLISAYFQWFRIRGPIISLLNRDEEQRAVLRPYEGLPYVTRQQFPEYREKYPGYAIVRLVFANSGDRAGFTKIVKAQVENPVPAGWSEKDQIKVSYYSHNLIPAYNLVQQDIILRNIPPVDADKEISFVVNVDWGGPNAKSGEYNRKGVIESKLKMVLHPSIFEKSSSKASQSV